MSKLQTLSKTMLSKKALFGAAALAFVAVAPMTLASTAAEAAGVNIYLGNGYGWWAPYHKHGYNQHYDWRRSHGRGWSNYYSHKHNHSHYSWR
jgi:hypothetical protein